jgi:hypothetical protein
VAAAPLDGSEFNKVAQGCWLRRQKVRDGEDAIASTRGRVRSPETRYFTSTSIGST